MAREVDQELLTKLETLLLLTAAQVGTQLTVAERMLLLNRLGLDRTQIARVCGTTPDVVSVRLAEARRKKKQNRR